MDVFSQILKNNNNSLSNETHSKTPSVLICFSHLRWNFVYQRPQHLLSRFAARFTVLYVEEPYWDAPGEPVLTITSGTDNLWVVAPHLPDGINQQQADKMQKDLLDKFLRNQDFENFIFWYYTPMALSFSEHIEPGIVVYDCMDELSMFKNPPPQLRKLEETLLKKADIVFTGGQSLYEFKKNKHPNIYPFPSSIDKKHFEQARTITEEPEDQKRIAGPKLGFYGVIDERFDLRLIEQMALQKPGWNFVLLGPVVKIDHAHLPRLHNIHYLGGKSYNELPRYVSGWSVALIPFLLNDATRFISPTKTPEYLAAGVPVVSTPITDVVHPYGEKGIVKIASDAQGFIEAAEQYMQMDKTKWLPIIDEFIADKSWSATFTDMMKKINTTIKNKQPL
jgi:glycosyltransferase involved in cell wall biosynthesis